MTSEQRPESSGMVSHVDIRAKSILDRGNSKCKGLEEGAHPVYERNSKEASMA